MSAPEIMPEPDSAFAHERDHETKPTYEVVDPADGMTKSIPIPGKYYPPVPTVRVQHGDGFRVINAADFDPKAHREYVDRPAAVEDVQDSPGTQSGSDYAPAIKRGRGRPRKDAV